MEATRRLQLGQENDSIEGTAALTKLELQLRRLAVHRLAKQRILKLVLLLPRFFLQHALLLRYIAHPSAALTVVLLDSSPKRTRRRCRALSAPMSRP